MRCLLVYPEFTLRTFWNFRATCELQGAKYPATPLGLITVAAMLPSEWEIKLVDCNVEPLRDDDLQWADVVMTGGMLSQQPSTLAIIARAQGHDRPVVVGGPDATSSPHIYDHADHLVLGEAELTLPRWLNDFAEQRALPRYEPGTARADVTHTPTPRFDLLKLDRYLYPSVQFARGCPFLCEFCDIIELFGRVPRLKSPAQLLRELDAIYALGYRGLVDIVDDNFIGNKRDVKKLLPELIAWQERHGYPFEFSTEATINLADDDALLSLMQRANFLAVFIGIESSDDDVLLETRKAQNSARDLAASVQKLYSYGMWVSAGFILGFDGERPGIAPHMTKLIREAAIPIAMVGLLYALPGTQLTRRLAREGRLFDAFDRADERDTGGDQCASGLNFQTLRPRIDVLRDYAYVLEQIYEPHAFFERVRQVGLALNFRQHKNSFSWRVARRDLRSLLRILWRMGIKAPYRREFWSTLWTVGRGNPHGLRIAISLATFYLHLGEFSLYLRERVQRAIQAEESLAQQAALAATQP